MSKFFLTIWRNARVMASATEVIAIAYGPEGGCTSCVWFAPTWQLPFPEPEE